MYHCGQRGRVGDGKEGDCRLWWGEGFRGRLNFCGMCTCGNKTAACRESYITLLGEEEGRDGRE